MGCFGACGPQEQAIHTNDPQPLAQGCDPSAGDPAITYSTPSTMAGFDL